MRVSILDIAGMKQRGEKIPMLTAYDYVTAKLMDEAGIPFILVGDSLGMVMLGYKSTIQVTMDDMLHHIKAVVRGTEKALVVGDMPFMSYHVSISESLHNAGRIIQEGGAQAIKLEGGEQVAGIVERIVGCGIPVMGHLGLTPQSSYQLGGFKVQGKTPEAARQLLKDALALQQAGAFSLVLECVPSSLAKMITQELTIPIIGIGAGPDCDGQVQVVSDILGLYTDFVPKHTSPFAHLAEEIKKAVSDYASRVKDSSFPTEKQGYSMDKAILEGIDFRH